MQHSGFTLIELMVTLAIVSLLASIAYPSYSGHLRHARRQQAELALMGLANDIESYHSLKGDYLNFKLSTSDSKTNNLAGHYQLAIEAIHKQSYQLAAIPENDQLKDECGILSVNELGDRLADGSINSRCW